MKSNLQASYYKTVHVLDPWGHPADVQIFANPTTSDIKTLAEHSDVEFVRFLGDSRSQQMYIWSGDAAEHDVVTKALGLDYVFGRLYTNYLCGMATIEGRHLNLMELYQHEKIPKWAAKYFSNIEPHWISAAVTEREVQEGLKAVRVLVGAEWEFEFKPAIAEEMKSMGGDPKTEKYLEQVAGASINFEPWLQDLSHTEKKTWVLERDISLNSVTGAELVCPPMPLQKFLQICPRILHAIGKLGKTTNKCGLHINLSIPHISERISVLKLLLLIDEDRVYKSFNKKARSPFGGPVKSMLKEVIQQNIKVTPQALKAGKLFAPFEDELEDSFRIHAVKEYGINPGKLQQGYIEFRYTGGSGYHKKWDRIQDMIGMYVFLLKAACDSNYKQREYRQKLSDLLNKEIEDQQHLVKDTREWLKKLAPLLRALHTKLVKVERSVDTLYLYPRSGDYGLEQFVKDTSSPPLRYSSSRHAIEVDLNFPRRLQALLDSKFYNDYEETRKRAVKLRAKLEKQLEKLNLPPASSYTLAFNPEPVLLLNYSIVESPFYPGVTLQNILEQMGGLKSGSRYDNRLRGLVSWISFPL